MTGWRFESAVVPVDNITLSSNVRRDVGDTSELEASISAVGLMTPVVVAATQNGKPGFELVAGYRRLQAVTNLGHTEVAARVVDFAEDDDDREAHRKTLQLVENLQRVDLDALEEAAGYAQLKLFGWKQGTIASNVGRSESHVSKRLALLDLPDTALDLHEAGRIGSESLYELTKVSAAGGDITPIIEGLTAHKRPDEAVVHEEVKRAVAGVVAATNARKQVAARRQELVDKLIVSHEADPRDLPKGHRQLGWGLDVDVDKHRAEPCAAVYVWEQWGKVAEADICTDPARHAINGESVLKVPADIYEGRPPARDRILDRVAALYLDNVWAEVSKRAIKLLDLDTEIDDYRELKTLYESATTADRSRILLAVTLADGHTRTTANWSGPGLSEDDHLNFLADIGHPFGVEDES